MRYSPVVNPKEAIRRRNLVLSEMRRDGFITLAQMEAAQKEPLVFVSKELDKNFAGYFVEMIRQHLQRNFSNRQIFSEGLKVYSTLDRNLQRKRRAVHPGRLAEIRQAQGQAEQAGEHLEGSGTRLETCKLPTAGQARGKWRHDRPGDGNRPKEARIRIGEFSRSGHGRSRLDRRKTMPALLERGRQRSESSRSTK
jgi:membrane carboxypeptidase/penicillin-binding protein